MLGFPNKPMGFFLLKNDQHLGCEMGEFPPPFKANSHVNLLVATVVDDLNKS